MSMENMKVVALGGSGGMGRWAVRTALAYDFVKEIVIADLDEVRGQAFADKCGEKTSFQKIDATDQSALKGLLSGADVVMTTVGPYYRFGVPILEAAIEAGCHYIDINDDWEPTLEMLDLHDKAEKAGITAIVGLGASPGQSNMVAAKALSLLDSADELITAWRASSAGDPGEEDAAEEGLEASGTFGAATEHWVHQFTGTIRVLRDGEFVNVKPIQEISIDYPDIGKGIAYTVGHPEPVTLPLFRTDIKQSCNVMVITPGQAEVLRETASEVDAGETTVREAASQLMARLSERQSQESDPSMEEEPRLPGLFAVAKGMKEGKRKTVAVTVTAGGLSMGEATGVPLAIGLKLLNSGKMSRHGVFAPEKTIDPDDFFNELAPLCTYPSPMESADEMLYITESSN